MFKQLIKLDWRQLNRLIINTFNFIYLISMLISTATRKWSSSVYHHYLIWHAYQNHVWAFQTDQKFLIVFSTILSLHHRIPFLHEKPLQMSKSELHNLMLSLRVVEDKYNIPDKSTGLLKKLNAWMIFWTVCFILSSHDGLPEEVKSTKRK